MKQQLFNNIKLIAFALVFAIGLSYAYAAWSEPTASAPGDNIDIPVNNGPISQIKSSNLSVGAFLVTQNAQFDQVTLAGGVVRGGTPSDVTSTVNFGGNDAGTMRTVTVQANGGMRVQGTLRTQALSNTASLRNPVCADTLGNLVKCSSF